MRTAALLAAFVIVVLLSYAFGMDQGRMSIIAMYGVTTRVCDPAAPIKRCIPICESFAPAEPAKR